MIQVILFFLCIASLLFIIFRTRKNDVNDISPKNKDLLKRETEKPANEDIVNGIKKSRWITIFIIYIALSMINSIFGESLNGLYDMLYMKISGKEVVDVIGWIIIQCAVFMFKIIVIIIWLIYDIYKTKNTDDKVVLLAYVQAAFVSRNNFLRKNRSKTLQLVYYDSIKDRFRLKTIIVDKKESEQFKLFRNDMVYIVAVQKRNSIKYLDFVRAGSLVR